MGIQTIKCSQARELLWQSLAALASQIESQLRPNLRGKSECLEICLALLVNTGYYTASEQDMICVS
jgi:hypothetical protein